VIVFSVLVGVSVSSILIKACSILRRTCGKRTSGKPLDWNYPQFLASPQQLAARKVDYDSRSLQPYHGETTLSRK